MTFFNHLDFKSFDGGISINERTGNLFIVENDLTLKGINGNDIVINRFYDLSDTVINSKNERLIKSGPYMLDFAWSYDFPYIEYNYYTGVPYLDLGTKGRFCINGPIYDGKYVIEDTSFDEYTLTYDYELGSSTNKCYILTYKDGSKYYFGRRIENDPILEYNPPYKYDVLTYYVDKYGNVLEFQYDQTEREIIVYLNDEERPIPVTRNVTKLVRIKSREFPNRIVVFNYDLTGTIQKISVMVNNKEEACVSYFTAESPKCDNLEFIRGFPILISTVQDIYGNTVSYSYYNTLSPENKELIYRRSILPELSLVYEGVVALIQNIYYPGGVRKDFTYDKYGYIENIYVKDYKSYQKYNDEYIMLTHKTFDIDPYSGNIKNITTLWKNSFYSTYAEKKETLTYSLGTVYLAKVEPYSSIDHRLVRKHIRHGITQLDKRTIEIKEGDGVFKTKEINYYYSHSPDDVQYNDDEYGWDKPYLDDIELPLPSKIEEKVKYAGSNNTIENTYIYRYDAKKNLLEESMKGNPYKTTVYKYNELSQVTEKYVGVHENDDSGDIITKYTYDESGILVTEEKIQERNDMSRKIKHFDYDSYGNMIKWH